MGCISTLSKPRFTAIDMFGLTLPPLPSKNRNSILCDGLRPMIKFLVSEDLGDIIVELQDLTSVLNISTMDLATIHRAITPIQHHILFFQSSGSENPPNGSPRELCCTGVLLYLKTVFDYHFCLQFGGLATGASIDIEMVQQLKNCVVDADTNTAPARAIFLSLVFLGGMAVAGTKDRAWFVARLAKTIMELQIWTWEDAKLSLATFLWVDKIHERSCRELWEEALVTVDELFRETADIQVLCITQI